MAGGKKRWVADALAYTLAGGLASAFVGATLGWLGSVLVPAQGGGHGVPIALAVAMLALTRELGILPFPLPQLPRQTRDTWAVAFPSSLAAALWGFDLGLVFTTWLTFSGAWLLAAVALLTGVPSFGAALFTLHWLGRALAVWLTPLLLPDAGATPWLLGAIAGQRRLVRRLHALGLAWVIVVLVVWVARGL